MYPDVILGLLPNFSFTDWVVCPVCNGSPFQSYLPIMEYPVMLLFFLWWLINFVVPTACLRSWAFKAANARAISIGDVQLEHQAWFISFLGVFNVATLAALWPRVPLVVCQVWAGCGEARRRMKRREAQSPGEYAVALEMLKNVISYPIYSIWSSGMLTVFMSAALYYSCDWVTIWKRPVLWDRYTLPNHILLNQYKLLYWFLCWRVAAPIRLQNNLWL